MPVNSGQYCFPPHLRLLTSSDFKTVFDNTDIKVFDKNFIILGMLSTLPYPRLGIVVAKKKIRKANDRNRLKRTVRESFRLNQSILSGVDLIVIPSKNSNLIDKSILTKSLSRAWKKAEKSHYKLLSSRPENLTVK